MSGQGPEDARLIERCQRGDREAFDELVRRYQQKAYQFAYHLCADADDAADLTAEAFARGYSALPRFRRESRFSTWLFRIITNCFLDMKKREKHRKHQSMDEIVTAFEGEVGRQFGSPAESPVEADERLHRGQLMQAAITRLPEYQRVMITLFHVEMLSYEEIAQTLDMPEGTVKSRLNRARLALREILEPHEELFRL